MNAWTSLFSALFAVILLVLIAMLGVGTVGASVFGIEIPKTDAPTVPTPNMAIKTSKITAKRAENRDVHAFICHHLDLC